MTLDVDIIGKEKDWPDIVKKEFFLKNKQDLLKFLGLKLDQVGLGSLHTYIYTNRLTENDYQNISQEVSAIWEQLQRGENPGFAQKDLLIPPEHTSKIFCTLFSLPFQRNSIYAKFTQSSRTIDRYAQGKCMGVNGITFYKAVQIILTSSEYTPQTLLVDSRLLAYFTNPPSDVLSTPLQPLQKYVIPKTPVTNEIFSPSQLRNLIPPLRLTLFDKKLIEFEQARKNLGGNYYEELLIEMYGLLHPKSKETVTLSDFEFSVNAICKLKKLPQ